MHKDLHAVVCTRMYTEIQTNCFLLLWKTYEEELSKYWLDPIYSQQKERWYAASIMSYTHEDIDYLCWQSLAVVFLATPCSVCIMCAVAFVYVQVIRVARCAALFSTCPRHCNGIPLITSRTLCLTRICLSPLSSAQWFKSFCTI